MAKLALAQKYQDWLSFNMLGFVDSVLFILLSEFIMS